MNEYDEHDFNEVNEGGPRERIEGAFDNFSDAIDSNEGILDAALDMVKEVVSAGLEVFQETLGRAMDILEESGVLEQLSENLGELGDALQKGLEHVLEMPPEDVIRVLAAVLIAAVETTKADDQKLLNEIIDLEPGKDYVSVIDKHLDRLLHNYRADR